MGRRRRDHRADAPVTREEFDALEQLVRRAIQKGTMGLGIQSVLGGGGGGDDGYEWWFDGNASSATDADTVGGYAPGDIPYITDGAAPASSPTPTAQGGPRFFAVKWAAVANADLVTYEVHVGTTSGFTPDGTTLVGETPGLLAFIRKLPDGSDFVYDTDYYFKLIAKDGDGSAAAGTASAAERLDPNGTDDILAGAVTAEKIESVLNLSTSFLAGTFGSANVQVGFGVKDDGTGSPTLDPSFLGVRAYDGDPSNSDPIFKLPADGSPAHFRGRVLFGSNGMSKLLTNDQVQLEEQPGGSWQNINQIQTTGGVGRDATSIDVAWDSTPTVGNLLIVTMICRDQTVTPNISSIGPGTWTQIRTNLFGSGDGQRNLIYYKEAEGGANDDFTITWNTTMDVFVVDAFEFEGVQAAVHTTSNQGEDATGGVMAVSSGATGAISQDALVFGQAALYGELERIGRVGDAGAFPGLRVSSYPADWTLIADTDYDDGDNGALGGSEVNDYAFWKVQNTGTESLDLESNADTATLTVSIHVFPAKAVAVDSAEADTVRVYGADINSETYLHTVDENGRKGAVVLGQPGEVWRWEYVTVSVNLPNVAGHSSTTVTPSISGLQVGDLIFYLGRDAGGGAQFKIEPESPVCSTAGQITLRAYNADAAAADPAAVNYHFLVIHRS